MPKKFEKIYKIVEYDNWTALDGAAVLAILTHCLEKATFNENMVTR